MRNKKIKLVFGIFIIAAAAFFILHKIKTPGTNGELIKEIKPFRGAIESIISTTGLILPKNRLEIKPPVNGRVEEIYVKEGEKVKVGTVLAQMSSTERAFLLDAARGKGEGSVDYWKTVYKGIPLVSPIDGEVIVATTQPGQTVTTTDAVIVLSDRLIVRAQLDETDIGKINLGQDALIILDAYPDIKIKAKVDHIYYESKIVNNVTIYEVDLIPESMPSMLRSGMNTTVNFIEKSKDDALLVPSEALIKEKTQVYLLLKNVNSKEYLKQEVQIGMSDDKNVEIISGLSPDDSIIIRSKKYAIPTSITGSNPFMPWRSRRPTDKK